MGEQTNTVSDARQELDQQIRQTVLAWLKDLFGNGRYKLGNLGSGGSSRDHYLEVTNATNVDLRQLQMQIEIYKGQIKVDQVTAKTTVSGIRAGQAGRITFFTRETGFTGLKLLPDTVTYKADWTPEQPLQKEKKRGWFGRRKDKGQQVFQVGSQQEKSADADDAQRLEQLADQARGMKEEEIAGLLDQLVPLVKNIFKRAKEVPDSEEDLKGLTNRYLPMIISSTQSYLSYAGREVTGEDMEDLKADVISGIRMVTEACSNLLNRLYEDGIVDASADVSVLKMLLKQDGLLNSEFDPGK